MSEDGPALWLPSCGPEPLPAATALAAVTGYARGRRWLRFRSPGVPEGRWVRIPAFGWARFDARPAGGPGDDPGDDDVLVAEALHGRLDRDGWSAVDEALTAAGRLADAAAERAAGRPFWELPGEELSVLGEPGTVGALLREIGRLDERFAGYVLAALHHRRPALVPHLTRTTRRAMLPFLEEGDSGVEAVVHRELRNAADAFAALEAGVATRTGVAVTRLRLHDILLWLTTTLRLPAAVALAESSPGTS